MKLNRDLFLVAAEPGFRTFVGRVKTVLYIAVAAFVVFGALWGQSLYIGGNLHDAFIWLNAGYFVDSGLRPYTDFPTPLGPLYIYLNYWAWLVLDRVSDIPLLIGGAVFVLLAAFLLAARKTLHRDLLPDLLFFLLILLMSGRRFRPGLLDIAWYGHYNRISWAFLLVFIFLLISSHEAMLRPTERQKTFLAVAGGVFLALLFLIKVSFFVALGIVYFTWAVLGCRPRDIRVFVVPAAIVGAAIVTVHFTVADLGAYVADIVAAASARADGGGGSRLGSRELWAPAGFVLANYFIDRWGHPDDSLNTRRLLLWAAVALAFTIAISGDYDRPVAFFGIILAVRVLIRREELFQRIRERTLTPATVVMLLVPLFAINFVVIESASLLFATGQRLNMVGGEGYQRVVWQQPGGDRKSLDFIIARYRLSPGYSELAEIIDASPDRDRLFEAISGIEGLVFWYDNTTYVPMIEEAVEVIGREGYAAARVFALEFTNPLPLLLGGPSPAPSPLWIHAGTTFGITDFSHLDRTLDNAEIVARPHVTIDVEMRPILNRMFARYNRMHGRFCKFYVGKYWTFYRACA